jgi:uncharacterized membrane protein YbhN (UPF0104 family)
MPGPLSLKQILKIIISVVLLAFLLHYTGFEDTLKKLSQANLWYVPVGIALYLGSQLISAYRWKFLSAPLGFRLSFREFYDYYLIGMFFNLFLPGAIGGDMLRMVYLAKSAQRKKREALLTLLAERGVGLVALLLLTSLVSLSPPLMGMDLRIPLKFLSIGPIYFDLRVLLLSLSSFLLMGYLALWCVPLERLIAKAPKLEILRQAKVYWANVALLCKSVSMSLVVHCVMVLIHVLVAAALHVHVDVLYLTVVYGIVSLASVLPIAFNGFGVREGTYLLLLTKAGIPPQTAMAFAFYWVIISTCTSLVGGLVLLKGHYKTPTVQDETDDDPEIAPEEPAMIKG